MDGPWVKMMRTQPWLLCKEKKVINNVPPPAPSVGGWGGGERERERKGMG